ncbi:Syntaxin-32 [Porphyridium purpureum]|uniref:Syntaxin-32 n=1 Tax=Porphyridium purpureum TaxID=35688 RepID=A0A5J4Z6N2_PORPP|nr:Syntaxin-32 [Porphyridium purpureum]|eukprot:POR3236..scf295_1
MEQAMAVTSGSVRDRTAEFCAALESARRASGDGRAAGEAGGVGAAANAGAAGRRPGAKSQFALSAADMAKDIQRTSMKLQRLTDLAQRRSLFDDPALEIQELTFVIKQEIAGLNNKLEALQMLQNQERGVVSKQAGDHSGSVVNSLKTRLMDTASEFKTVLKMRTESLQAQQNRRSQFLGEASPTQRVVPPASAPHHASQPTHRYSTGGPGAAAMAANNNSHASADSADVVIDLGSGSTANEVGGAAGSGNFRHQEFRQQLQMARPEATYLQARAEAVKQVESTIAELGQIFTQLATMVSEQGEMVERIDANVDDTMSNLEEGRTQLMRYYNSLSSNRGLILKIFATIFLFMLLWVFLA